MALNQAMILGLLSCIPGSSWISFRIMSAANNFVSDLYAVAKEKGLDAVALLRDADISEEVIGATDVRVERQALAKFQVNIWNALDDEAMGLSDFPIRRGTFQMLGKLAVSESTLRDALLMGANFQRVALGVKMQLRL